MFVGWRVVYQKNTSLKILPLKKANAESIYSALVEKHREKNIQLGRLIGMAFGGFLCKLLMLHQVSSRSTLP